MEEARVSMASEPGKARIINQASISNKPVSPNVSKNIYMALILGSFMECRHLDFHVNLGSA